MRCLQEKYHELETECKDAVRNHTSITMTDPTLDFYLMKACESVIQEFCLVRSFTSPIVQLQKRRSCLF